MPSRKPSLSHGRISARLARLPHAALLELTTRLCLTSASAWRDADRFLAEHDPLPPWAVSDVLLSDDLVPDLMAPLALEQRAALAVCTAWRRGWRDTAAGRRQLRTATLLPQPESQVSALEMWQWVRVQNPSVARPAPNKLNHTALVYMTCET